MRQRRIGFLPRTSNSGTTTGSTAQTITIDWGVKLDCFGDWLSQARRIFEGKCPVLIFQESDQLVKLFKPSDAEIRRNRGLWFPLTREGRDQRVLMALFLAAMEADR
jgi:hypothetical protein